MEKKLYFDRLKQVLSVYYDLDENLDTEYGNIDLYAKYFEKNDRYILNKESVIYSQEAFEHIFCKYFESITLEEVKVFTKYLENNITNFVKPSEDHMSSIMRGVIITNQEPDEETINYIKKYKYYKSFLFGFKGWVNIGLNLVDINNRDNFYYNKVGKNGKDYFKV